MKTQIRFIGPIGLMSLACLCNVGCSSHQDSGKIVIRVGNWGGAKEGNDYDKLVEKIYRDFERENPSIEVREESSPGEYVAKISLAYLAKAEPDVLMLDASSSAMFINSGIVTDLTPEIQQDSTFKLADYFPNVVDIGRRGNKLFSIPQDFTPMVVYYNKRLFREAGVPFPSSDWNFAQFRETAKSLTRRSSKGQQYGFAFSNWPAGWVMWLWNNGSDHISPDGTRAHGFLDSSKSAEAVAFLRDVVDDGSSPTISQATSLGVDLFANGQAAMTVSGHWSLVGYKAAPTGPDGKPTITWDDIGVVCMPHNVPQSQTVMYESGYAIGAHCKNRNAAWKFIRYMTSYRVQKQYQTSGIAICGRRDVAEERARESQLEASFLPIIPSARPPYGSRIEGYEYVETQMTKAMDSVLQSGALPQAALSKAAERIEKEWAKK